MTPQHIFYIPTIFLLGFIFGVIYTTRKETERNNTDNLLPSNKMLFLTFSIFIIVFIITHSFDVPYGPKQVSRLLNGQQIFDRKPLFSSSEVYAKIKTFSATGIDAYKRFTYTIDIIFPISFFAFLLTFARYVSSRSGLKKMVGKALMLFPILWFLSDLLENLTIFTILSAYPEQNEILGDTIGKVTIIKYGLLICSLIAPILVYGYSRIKGSSGKFS